MNTQDIWFNGLLYDGAPHKGGYTRQPVRLVAVGFNKETGRQIVREKRYLNRSKY